jgi:hypothetical protein
MNRYPELRTQNDSGQGFFAMFRVYGPLEPLFNGTWKLHDVKRVT